uniref:Uncharacterized protein n=1 Tax=Anguilla anguilla TaxID=7936 RepID=A0A0E9VDY3_ANGAN
MQDPSASRTARLAKFSEAISSRPNVCLFFSFLMISNTCRARRTWHISFLPNFSSI